MNIDDVLGCNEANGNVWYFRILINMDNSFIHE